MSGFFLRQTNERIVRLERFVKARFAELYREQPRYTARLDYRDARAINQEFLDQQEAQIKKLANFEIGKEQEFRRMRVYDFLFHLHALDKHAQDQEK
jgi:hypothetical protein